jgi:hypothetical protein
MAAHPVELTPEQNNELGDHAPGFRYML